MTFIIVVLKQFHINDVRNNGFCQNLNDIYVSCFKDQCGFVKYNYYYYFNVVELESENIINFNDIKIVFATKIIAKIYINITCNLKIELVKHWLI